VRGAGSITRPAELVVASRFLLAATLLAGLCCASCQPSETSAPQRSRTLAEEFRAELDRTGHVTFRSWLTGTDEEEVLETLERW
jgi:hypothetical protein